MKKLYTCKHQKEATSPCSVCQEGRKKSSYNIEHVSNCDKCGELVKKGSFEAPDPGENGEKYREEWVEEHNCQLNPEKVKEREKQKEEIERARKEVEERQKEEQNKKHNPDSPLPSISESEDSDDNKNIIYKISCKFCGQYWSESMPKQAKETFKEKAKEWLIKNYQEHQRKFAKQEVNKGNEATEKDKAIEETLAKEDEQLNKIKELERERESGSNPSSSASHDCLPWIICGTAMVFIGIIIYLLIRRRKKK